MADDVGHMILHWMRALDQKFDKMADDVGRLTNAVRSIERRQASMAHDIATVQMDIADIRVTLDSYDRRLSRLEKRAGLIEETPV